MDGRLAAHAGFTQAAAKFVLVKADLSSRSPDNPWRAVAQQFQVTGLPDIRIIDATGRVISSPEADPGRMVDAMEEALRK